MAEKTFTATRSVTAGDGKRLASWCLSQGTGAQIVRFCNGTAAAPLIEIQVPANSSTSQAYPTPLFFPLGLHCEVVNANLVRGAVDLV
jgi:hypothetical protein